MYCITKWTKHITDSGKDEYTGRFKHMQRRLTDEYGWNGTPYTVYDFRLLDDDGIIYAYGKSDRMSFDPLDKYEPLYGCTEIQYRDPESGKYRPL
jgi:hypothetical protein